MKPNRSLAVCVSLSLVASVTAQGSHLRYSIVSPDDDSFGRAVDAAGDVNADGVPDFVVGAPLDSTVVANAGGAWVYSGVDGSELLHLQGVTQEGWTLGVGRTVSQVGDMDGDGHDDVALSNPSYSGSDGLVVFYSGQDGSMIGSVVGNGYLGRTMRPAGDVNNDGRADVLISGGSDPFADGYIWVRDGASPAVLHTIQGSPTAPAGEMFDGVGDLNDDGHDDFVVGHPYAWVGSEMGAGFVSAYSGADGSILYQLFGSVEFEHLGHAVVRLGLVDGDAVPDFAIEAFSPTRRIDVVSGASGATIHSFPLSNGLPLGAPAVRAGGDVDGDGVQDLIVAIDTGPGYELHVYSGATGALVATVEAPNHFPSFAGPGDLDGDGYAEILVGAGGTAAVDPFARVYTAAAFVTDEGDGCVDGRGIQPGIDVPLRPRIGRDFRVDGFDIDPGAQAVWLFGDAIEGGATLFWVGAAIECRLYVQPFFASPGIPVGGEALESITVSVPFEPGLVGVKLENQWALVDGAQHLSVSGARRMHFGY